ncbi:putative solute carrier family 35 member SLC35F1/F2/F6 [Helianthus anomalus]
MLEFCVKNNGRLEVLTMLGLFGMLLSVIEMYPFMGKSGATLFNLSLLTANMWVVVIRIFFYHEQNPDRLQEPENGIFNTQYQLVAEFVQIKSEILSNIMACFS